ncbi:MAG: hypothetical protein IKE11_00025 [Clostridia bacterium]|nr:hypothetical protein [Clostridia bacterium]
MKRHNDTMIIAVDHGYGNMKTANHCFPSGVLVHEGEPTFLDNLLFYEDRYYIWIYVTLGKASIRVDVRSFA